MKLKIIQNLHSVYLILSRTVYRLLLFFMKNTELDRKICNPICKNESDLEISETL